MKTLKLILKGILMYTTLFAILIAIGAIDSLISEGLLIPTIIIVSLLITATYFYIDEEEFDILSLNKFFNYEDRN